MLYNNTPGLPGFSCATCHTANPSLNVSKVLRGASNPNQIASAINGNTGGMGALKGKFTSADLADIAAYLANPGI
ncbi:MAG: cytochrome c [Burkholderiaceae bacterium]